MSTATEMTPTYFENGDRMTREEFHRIYEQMPGVKAELINGVVHVHGTYDARRRAFMASPVRATMHASPHWLAATWLGFYALDTPGVWGADNATVQLPLAENEPQPDLFLRILTECGGQSHIDKDGYIVDAPELLIEVAASTRSIDLGSKKTAYRENGVREYVVWRVLDDDLDWFSLEDGDYVAIPAIGGTIKSRVFPGLWLNVDALLSDDLRGVFDAVRRGTATTEHASFVAKLAAAKARTLD